MKTAKTKASVSQTAAPVSATPKASRAGAGTATGKSARKPASLAAVAQVRGEMIAAEDAGPWATERGERAAKPSGGKNSAARKGAAGKSPAAKSGEASKAPPATRVGRKGFVLYLKPDALNALRRLALDTGLDPQTLGHRALAMVFEAHGVTLPKGALDAPERS